MALSYLTDINLNKNELQNAVIQKVASDPTSGLTEGWIIYNTTDDALKVYSAKQVSGSDEGWISVAGDIKSVVAGSGLTGGGEIGTITLNVVGGTGITANANDIAITDTSVTAGSYGSATAIPTFTVNAQGQLTAAGTASITTTLTIDGDSTTQDVALADDDLKIVGTTNEIETAVTKSGTDVSLQIGLPSNVTVGNNV